MSENGEKARRKPLALRLEETGQDEAVHGDAARGLTLLPEPQPLALTPAAAPARPPRRRFWASLAATGLGGLLSLSLGLAVSDLVSRLFEYSPILGAVGLGFAALLTVALLVLLGREIMALARLARVEELRSRAEAILASDDRTKGRALAGDLMKLYAAHPDTARARGELHGDLAGIVDGADLVRLSERRLMAALDAQALRLITNAAKRVSVVTALAPRAIFDVAMVIAQSVLLVRKLAELYGARPGGLASLKLARVVLGHLAITGGMALGESVVEQFLGQGLASKLSAKLGEGVVNGMMTARVGLSTLDIVRPLPFTALARPKLADILNEIAQLK